MGRYRCIFICMSIIFETSLISGLGFHYLVPQNAQDNEGGLVLSETANSYSSFQEEEIITDEGYTPAGSGGPYMVAPSLHFSTYRARNGDNIWTIAKKNKLDFFTLLTVNRLKQANDISVGQKLRIPNQCGILHTVREGESIEDIALMYNAGIRKIIRVNRILDPSDIKKGKDLFIPGAKITLDFGKEILKSSGIDNIEQFLWPCHEGSRRASRFGYRKDPFTGRRAFHSGLDFSPGYGAGVYASMDGVVTYAGWMGGYGKLVVVQHSDRYSTRYGHLSRILVVKGNRVRQGTRVGYVGNTGRSTGAHLHFEIRQNGKALNPGKLVGR